MTEYSSASAEKCCMNTFREIINVTMHISLKWWFLSPNFSMISTHKRENGSIKLI